MIGGEGEGWVGGRRGLQGLPNIGEFNLKTVGLKATLVEYEVLFLQFPSLWQWRTDGHCSAPIH